MIYVEITALAAFVRVNFPLEKNQKNQDGHD
jgi:hypothetical protein